MSGVTKSIVTGGAMVLYITSKNATCGYGSGNIIVQVANGTPPYSYKMDTYPAQNTGNFPVVGAGDHTIVVTDATGATVTATVTLTNILPGPITLFVNVTKNPSNCTTDSGQIEILAIGGTPPYSYSMDLINFQAGNTFSNLYPGAYYAYVKDANGCIGTNTIFLNGRGCDGLALLSPNYVCGDDGSITVRDLEPNGPFTYSIDNINYQDTGYFPNISVGPIQIFIKDKNGKLTVFGSNAAEFCDLGIQYITVDAACMQNNGVMTVSVSNGVAPFLYTIDGINYQPSPTFTGLAPGNYFITAKDATGTTSSLEAMVYDKCPVVAAVSTGQSCAGADGTITAGGFKGTAPYQFSIDGIHFQTNNVFIGIPAGVYTVYIQDALGFTGTTNVIVVNNCLNVSLQSGNSVCGKRNGSITASATNGTPPYLYSLNGLTFQTSNIFLDLLTGPYTVTVKDSNSVVSSANITVGNTAGPNIQSTVLSASCQNNDGSVSAQASGGTTPYQYSLDGVNFQNEGLFNALDTGTKTVTVRDSEACSATQQIIVPLANNLTVDAGTNLTICAGTSSQLTAQSNGSSFLWSPAAGLSNPTILLPNAEPLTTTEYVLTASLGICQGTDSINMTVLSAPVADAGNDTAICYGKSAQLNGSGGVSYLWSPATYLDNTKIYNPTLAQPSNSITYHLTVYDANGCASLNPGTITVTVTPPPKLSAGNDTSLLVNQPLQLHAVDVDNSGFTTYAWSPSMGLDNPAVQNPIAYITSDIVYSVEATTPDGCEAKASISIKVFTVSGIFVPGAFTPNNDGRNDVLKPILRGMKELKYFTVYDRWGQRVYYSTESGSGWDGTFNGNTLGSGGYVWMAAGVDYTGKLIEKKGTVILIR